MFSMIFVIIFVLLGIYFIVYMSQPSSHSILEGYINSTDETNQFQCPNILLQKGIRYYLYNSKLATVPGVNPIEFQNLEDYTEFMTWQRSQGIRCPVLFLQYTYDAQGDPIYKGRPSPTDLQGGLPPAPSTTSSTSYLLGQPQTTTTTKTKKTKTTKAQDTIIPTSDDIMNQEKEYDDNLLHSDNGSSSANAMDDNWGGVNYTQNLVDEGVYQGDEVFLAVNN